MDIRHIKFDNGNEIWYDHDITPYIKGVTPLGKLHWHRVGGPAIVGQWYYKNTWYSFYEYCELVKPLMTEEDYFIMVLTYGGS